jgi:hypothetical protein
MISPMSKYAQEKPKKSQEMVTSTTGHLTLYAIISIQKNEA